MKPKYNREEGIMVAMPETKEEAVKMLYDFFTCDMWYAKGAEWKTESDMLKYLKTHFDICLKEMKECKK